MAAPQFDRRAARGGLLCCKSECLSHFDGRWAGLNRSSISLLCSLRGLAGLRSFRGVISVAYGLIEGWQSLPQVPITLPMMVFSPGSTSMVTTLFGVALIWLSLRTLLLLAQVNRFAPESRLSRAFRQELMHRGLIPDPADAERLMP